MTQRPKQPAARPAAANGPPDNPLKALVRAALRQTQDPKVKKWLRDLLDRGEWSSGPLEDRS